MSSRRIKIRLLKVPGKRPGWRDRLPARQWEERFDRLEDYLDQLQGTFRVDRVNAKSRFLNYARFGRLEQLSARKRQYRGDD